MYFVLNCKIKNECNYTAIGIHKKYNLIKCNLVKNAVSPKIPVSLKLFFRSLFQSLIKLLNVFKTIGIMKEFMLLIRNRMNHQDEWSDEMLDEFLKKCEVYIKNLKKEEKLISAQPLIREGTIISGKSGSWKVEPFNEQDEVQVGYYHILAKDMEEAISIAKGNPEFEFGTTARIEVRPVKTKEVTTNFEYPKASYSS